MDFEAVGLFMFLLCREWQEGSLTTDERVLQRLVGARVRDWGPCWSQVRGCFYERDGRLYNKRLEEERAVADGFSAKQSTRAKARWERFKAGRDATAMPRHSHGNATAMPRTGQDGTGQEEEGAADAALGFLAFGTLKEMNWEVSAVVTALRNLSGMAFENANDLHEMAQTRILGLGFPVDREVPIDVSQNTRDGRIDLVVRTEPPIAIELDRKSPRKGSVLKLARAKVTMGAVTVLVIRARGWDAAVEADLLVALADPNEVDKNANDVPIPTALDTPDFRVALDEWHAYRRERKLNAWRPVTIRSNYRQWELWGVAKTIDAIRTSIRSSWNGVFEPKQSTSNGYGATKNGSHAVPSAQQTTTMLEELRRTPTIAPPSNVRELFEEAKKKALASKA